MATGIKNNKLVLKVAVVYDSAEALKNAKKLQSDMDKQYDKNMSNRKSGMADDINSQNKGIKEQIGLLGKWGDGLSKVFVKMSQTAIFGAVFYGLAGTMRSAVDLAVQLDTAYTNLAIVSKMTATELIYVDEQVNTMTSSLGRMKKEVIDSITEFSRAGYSIADSMTLAKNAIMGANVGATSLDKITTYLIAGLKSFKMEAEDSARILDVLFTVANITAIDLEGIGEAFLRSANTLKSAGATLEEATALLAAANESIQDPTKVGTALKTIASRLRGVGDEGEVIPTLAKDFEAVGISIQNADGSFRNIYDIFKELASVYNELDDLTRQSLLEKIAGKRQINIMIGLLENFDLAEKSLEAGMNSAGNVAIAQEKYLQSLEGRINLLKEGWNKFLTALTDSEGIKTAISAITDLVKVLTFLAESLPAVLFGIAGAGVALSAILFPPIAPLLLGVGAITAGFGLFNQTLVATRSESEKAAKAMAKLDNQISDINTEIDKIKALPKDERTEAQKEYLKTLEYELDLKKQLRDVENEKIFAQNLKDAKSLKKEVEYIKRLRVGNEAAYGNNTPNVATQGVIGRLKAQEKELIKVRQARLLDIDSVAKGTALYNTATESLKEIDSALNGVYSEYDVLGVVYTNLFNKTEMLSNATDDFGNSVRNVMVDVTASRDNYQILSDAIVEVTENGYLTDEMFKELTTAFPDIIDKTGLASDAMVAYAKATNSSANSMIDDHIRLLETQKDVFKEQLVLYNESMKLLASGVGGNSELMYMAQFSLGQNIVAQANTALKNIDNKIGELRNKKKQFEGIDNERSDKLKPKDKKEKEIKILTETEAKVRELTNRIAMQQKIMERTEGFDAQISANLKMIELQKQLRDALIKEKKELDEKNKNLKRGQDGYEEYIDNTMKLSLEVEETTSNIKSFTDAITELNKAQSEAVLKKIKANIETISDAIEDSIEKNIAIQEELAKQRAKYYENEISKKQAEIDAINEQNDAIEEQVQLQELLLDLQELRERRQNILDNKNVRLVKNAETGFEWVSDPRELKQVNDDIIDAEKAIDKFRRDVLVQENIRKLELEIQGLENRAKAEQESYQERIDELNIFQDKVNEIISNNNNIPSELISSLQLKLESLETNSYGIRLDNLKTFISEYNRLSAGAKLEEGSYIYESQSPLNTELKDIAPLPNLSGKGSSSSSNSSKSGTTTTIAPKSSVVASKLLNGKTSTLPPISVNTVNVTSSSKTVDAIVTDAINKVKIMTQ